MRNHDGGYLFTVLVVAAVADLSQVRLQYVDLAQVNFIPAPHLRYLVPELSRNPIGASPCDFTELQSLDPKHY